MKNIENNPDVHNVNNTNRPDGNKKAPKSFYVICIVFTLAWLIIAVISRTRGMTDEYGMITYAPLFAFVGLIALSVVILWDIAAKHRTANEERSERIIEGENTPEIRKAGTEDGWKVFLETSVDGYEICYRRRKRVNELVVNGAVYDELTALVEPPHELYAVFGEDRIAAGTDANGKAYIAFNGKTLKTKFRL